MKLDKNKKILIVGLGLIGGSYAYALKEKGYEVGAITLNKEDIDYAVYNLEAKKRQYVRLLKIYKKEALENEDFE